MFNGEKLKELEARIAGLEKLVGGRYSLLPGENCDRVRYEFDKRIPLFPAVKSILSHLGLEFKRTPEALQLVATKKK